MPYSDYRGLTRGIGNQRRAPEEKRKNNAYIDELDRIKSPYIGEMIDNIEGRLERMSANDKKAIYESIARFFDRVVDVSYSNDKKKLVEAALANIDAATAALKISLPAKGEIPIYRRLEGERPSEYLLEHWKRYLDERVLYQHNLNALDPKLLKALRNEFVGRASELRKILPIKRDETDALISEAGMDPTHPRRARTAATLRQIKPPR